MTEERIYFGKSFYKNTQGYWVSRSKKIPWAHRWVWVNHYGPIPEGMHIHHKDEDKSNNDINNLQMVSPTAHLKIHWEDPEKRKIRRQFLNDIRSLAHKWLRSDQGRKNQSEDAKKSWGKRKPYNKICKQCSKEFTSLYKHTLFCHQNCYMQWVVKTGKYNIECKCPECGKMYFKHKFSRKRFCSISCGAKSSSRNRKPKLKVNIEPVFAPMEHIT